MDIRVIYEVSEEVRRIKWERVRVKEKGHNDIMELGQESLF